MAITKVTIEEFLQLAKTNLVLDVRSPSEYAQARIPVAKNLPLFDDEQRKIIGTAYKQQSKQIAIKLGLDFFGVKMKAMVEDVDEKLTVGGWQNAQDKKQKLKSNLQFAKNEMQTKDGCPLPIANCVLIHCWRGGMRSAGVAWLLDLYGFKVYTLVGGYKAYRNWVLQQFEKQYYFKIIGGYTGSGKTLILHELKNQHQLTIDLEGLASHKGSALGAMGQLPQPTQEMFENLLAEELEEKSNKPDNEPQTAVDRRETTDDLQQITNEIQITDGKNYELENEFLNFEEPTLNLQPSTLNFEPSTLKCNSSNLKEPLAKCLPPNANCIWLEDESNRIGNLQVPLPVWTQMRSSKVYFFDIPFEERLNYLTIEYGVHKKDELVTAIMRIQKRLGGLETKNAINFLLENNFKESFRILLTYYDKHYLKGLHNRDNVKELVETVVAERVDAKENCNLLKNL